MAGVDVSPRRRLLFLLIGIAGFGVLLYLSFQRTALNYGAETDFLGGFVPEATRFLAGGPLAVEYHPPLYAIALAFAYLGLGEWLRAGLFISLASALAALLASFPFFDRLYGRSAGLGAACALILSYPFLSYSMQATSDLFFLALSLSALMFFATAEVRERRRDWFRGGVLIGLAGLARTNGAALLGLLLSAARRDRRRRGALAVAAAGVAIPLASWIAVAAWTGSPLVPQRNYENLALTYHAVGDRTSGDAVADATAGMDSAWDVLSRNPRRSARIYVRDLRHNLMSLFVPDLLPFPFAQLAFPGLCVLLMVHVYRYGWVLPATLGAMFLVLNFKAWETRYYLLYVPFMGAGIGLSLAYLHAQAARAGRRRSLWAVLAVSLALGALQTGLGLRRDGWDLSTDAQGAAGFLEAWGAPPGSAVVARKPHVCFYSGLECVGFPDVGRMEELRANLERIVAGRPPDAKVFLFYGFAESATRPTLARPIRGGARVPWLRRVAEGGQRHMRWVLLEVVRESLGAKGTDRPVRGGKAEALGDEGAGIGG